MAGDAGKHLLSDAALLVGLIVALFSAVLAYQTVKIMDLEKTTGDLRVQVQKSTDDLQHAIEVAKIKQEQVDGAIQEKLDELAKAKTAKRR